MTAPSRPVAIAAAALALIAAPAAAHETPAERANARVVLDFYAALNRADADGAMRERIQGIAERYLAPDYVQHAAAFVGLPGPGSARDRLVRFFRSLPRPPAPPPPSTTIAVMAEGDRVMLFTSRPAADPHAAEPRYGFSMFRVRGGRLVEHWDVMEGAPPGPPPAPPR